MPTRTLNASCDRLRPNAWIGSSRSANRHFRRALAEYVAHYHGERNHQGLGNVLIAGRPNDGDHRSDSPTGPTRWSAQLLRASRVRRTVTRFIGSAQLWDIT